MNGYNRLKKIIDEIDVLIEKGIITSMPELQAWVTEAKQFLIDQYGKDSYQYEDFIQQRFLSLFSFSHFFELDRCMITACINGLKAVKMTFNRYLEEMQEDSEDNSQLVDKNENKSMDFKSVFIVHGKNDGLKQSVARIIERQNIRPIMLHEQTNGGDTIIEKLEKNSNVGAAICLFTADDLGCERPDAKENKEDKPKLMLRARQNVVLETGYFMAKLGRKHVIVVAKDEIEIPSDMQGIVCISLSSSSSLSSCNRGILRELKKIGYDIDFNKDS